MPYEARALANVVISVSMEKKIQLTHMALQKVLYYAHGWFLAQYKLPLVENGFEAWQHGPVIRTIYNSFKHLKDKKITSFASYIDLGTGEIIEPICQIEAHERKLIENVLDAYGHLHAYDLSRMTHEEGSPWDKIWHGKGATLGMRIPDDDILAHFISTRQRQRN